MPEVMLAVVPYRRIWGILMAGAAAFALPSHAQTVIAVPDTGSADAGIASRPIANVALNDSIAGAPATLGASGNATIAKLGTWPTGIGLNPTTGAVSTTVAVTPGTYTFTYQLCDKAAPTDCATATDSVTVIVAAILPTPDSGTADAGVASQPIANVAANDTVDGAPAVLGSAGNATIAKVGTWPTGIGLNTATGAVSTTIAVTPGTYTFVYQLCDRNSPAQCADATDSVTVITASIVANPASGTAVVGTASTPIASVVATDSVDGAAATLGTGGNATIARVGTWPPGFALNTSTGAITITGAVAAGSYSLGYKLCDHNSPAQCATATDTVTVSAAIVANADAGSAFVGTESIAIGNLLANDFVNGAPAVAGPSGNATVAVSGTWPAGISLNAATAAVTVGASVPSASYNLSYQLCDLNSTPDCATATISLLVTPPFPSVQASNKAGGDIEFDWARDGIFCSTCNYGATNSQVNWTDQSYHLWVNGVDHTTGLFTPFSGEGTLVDTTAFFWSDWGNGPEWAFSTPVSGQDVVSQLVYTRFIPGDPPTADYAGAALAAPQSATTWGYRFFPGAIGGNDNNTVLPEASQCNTDTEAIAVFQDQDFTPPKMYTEPVTPVIGTRPTLTPFGAYANGIGERWVPCTHWLTFQGNVTIDGNELQQVFWYDADTQVVQQLTFDPTTKQRALMFKAPEFQDQYVLMALAADDRIQIYLQNGTNPNGSPIFNLINTIYSPDPSEPFMFDPKAFVHCTPTCQTYIVMGLSQVVNSQQTQTDPNGLGVTNISPTNPFFEVLVSAGSLPATQRLDPKYFISTNGPLVYFAQIQAQSGNLPYKPQGVYFINMQLGAPSGSCVGSSAEGGLLPGC